MEKNENIHDDAILTTEITDKDSKNKLKKEWMDDIYFLDGLVALGLPPIMFFLIWTRELTEEFTKKTRMIASLGLFTFYIFIFFISISGSETNQTMNKEQSEAYQILNSSDDYLSETVSFKNIEDMYTRSERFYAMAENEGFKWYGPYEKGGYTIFIAKHSNSYPIVMTMSYNTKTFDLTVYGNKKTQY
jgi:hypothetical protein